MKPFKSIVIALVLALAAYILILHSKVLSVMALLNDTTANYLGTSSQTLSGILSFLIIASLFIFVSYLYSDKSLKKVVLGSVMAVAASAVYAMLVIDFFWILLKWQTLQPTFPPLADVLGRYLTQEGMNYVLLVGFGMIAGLLMVLMRFEEPTKRPLSKTLQRSYIVGAFVFPFLLVNTLAVLNVMAFITAQTPHFVALPPTLSFYLACVYLVVCCLVIGMGLYLKHRYTLKRPWLVQLVNSLGIGISLGIVVQVLVNTLPYERGSVLGAASQGMALAHENLKQNGWSFVILLVALTMAASVRKAFKKMQFDTEKVDDTSGNFGTAAWASKTDLENLNAYDASNGCMIGLDEHETALYLPLCNKLVISPPGTWKTSASSVLALLTHDGPVFVTDLKSGELWAIAARYRAEVLRRRVITIDPFNVIQGSDYRQGKPGYLTCKYKMNPFDFIPDDEKQRDRMINAFASSFIINEQSGHAQHFDENARILIRGYIDYMMKTLPKENRNLKTLFNLLSEHQNDAKLTFNHMAEKEGRAAAASNQVTRVGDNERGSILSTSYRQIDWMSDKNMQETFAESNFDLRQFLDGDTDIFVILPEEQVHEQSRLVRMIMALLKAIITQANPSELPKKKMLFLLEELAQLGYCPDVEQFVEVMRARGVVVWTVFQSLNQIEMYKKPDLFKGATLKQIFTLDDTKTMEWVQKLCGKKTVITKTLSTNSGDSKQKMQVFGGTLSKGEGESVQETGVDLIQLNQIREMPLNEQIVFLHGAKPIKCKKVRYFEHPFFTGKYDTNPLETRN